jgi:hypothetical protein
MSRARILFAGGCQTDGYPIGRDRGFSAVAMRALAGRGLASDSRRLPTLALSRSEALIEACRDCSPDIVVLQLANYETCLRVGVRVRKLLRRVGLRAGRRPPPDWAPRPAAQLRPDGVWRLRTIGAQALDAAVGHRLVDVPRVGQRFDDVLAQVTAATAARVIVIGPLPCAHPVVLRYRRELAPLVRRSAASHGCEYVDALHLFAGRSAASGDGLGADAIHLNAASHRLLGEHIGARLALHVRALTAPSSIRSAA